MTRAGSIENSAQDPLDNRSSRQSSCGSLPVSFMAKLRRAAGSLPQLPFSLLVDVLLFAFLELSGPITSRRIFREYVETASLPSMFGK